MTSLLNILFRDEGPKTTIQEASTPFHFVTQRILQL